MAHKETLAPGTYWAQPVQEDYLTLEHLAGLARVVFDPKAMDAGKGNAEAKEKQPETRS